MAFPLKCIIPPTSEPVSLTDMKLHLRVDIDADDDYISGLITAARQRAEDYMGRGIMPQQWVFALDRFPVNFFRDGAPSRSDYDLLGNLSWEGEFNFLRGNSILLPRGPLQQVDSITYVDNTGTTQTLDPSTYVVDDLSDPSQIVPAYGYCWPIAQYTINAVRVTFTVGYDVVPATFVHAIKLMVGSWYSNREDVVTEGTPKVLPRAAEHILYMNMLSHFGYAGRR